MKGFVLLQNAWSGAYAGSHWPRERWLWALENCKTGRTLMRVLPDDVWYDNTTPEVSAEANGVCPPNPEYVLAQLGWVNPDYVVACGKQAGTVAKKLWAGRLIVTPHPANRVVTNALFDRLKEIIDGGGFHRLELVQLRGSVSEAIIP